MRKTITLTIRINTDPTPISIYGLRREFVGNDWHRPEYSAYPWNLEEHGCLDAPEQLPAGCCWKACDHLEHRVYDKTVARPW
jgi:hypothetical protein